MFSTGAPFYSRVAIICLSLFCCCSFSLSIPLLFHLFFIFLVSYFFRHSLFSLFILGCQWGGGGFCQLIVTQSRAVQMFVVYKSFMNFCFSLKCFIKIRFPLKTGVYLVLIFLCLVRLWSWRLEEQR